MDWKKFKEIEEKWQIGYGLMQHVESHMIACESTDLKIGLAECSVEYVREGLKEFSLEELEGLLVMEKLRG